MKTVKLVLKLKSKQFSAILALAERVHGSMQGNSTFPSPAPSLSVVHAEILTLTDSLAKWGVKGNRGSHVDYVNLEAFAIRMYAFLQSLAGYCESTVITNVPVGEWESALASSGFALKKQKSPQGRLEMVQNFHHFIARNVRRDEVKLR